MQANALQYMSGFGGHFESEAVEGALPKGTVRVPPAADWIMTYRGPAGQVPALD